jgi:poly-gamma-glutamate capsule biosynthesis protein CapA/YwtB (metallophosphatase superfamily)
MHPANIPALTVAGMDYCSLANNHALDWGFAGLAQTLAALKQAGMRSAGAGRDLRQARAPAVLEVAGKGRVIVFSFGLQSSGIPAAWAASPDRPGVNLLKDLSSASIRDLQAQVAAVEEPGDIVVASIHNFWGQGTPA